MIFVTLAALLVAAFALFSTAALLRSQQRAHARERTALLDRLMHLADKTWTPPPADEPKPTPEPEEHPGRYTAAQDHLLYN